MRTEKGYSCFLGCLFQKSAFPLAITMQESPVPSIQSYSTPADRYQQAGTSWPRQSKQSTTKYDVEAISPQTGWQLGLGGRHRVNMGKTFPEMSNETVFARNNMNSSRTLLTPPRVCFVISFSSLLGNLLCLGNHIVEHIEGRLLKLEYSNEVYINKGVIPNHVGRCRLQRP